MMAIPQAILLIVVSFWGIASGISVVLVVYAVLSDVVCSSRSDVASDRLCRATMKTNETYMFSRNLFVSSSLVAIACSLLLVLYNVTTT